MSNVIKMHQVKNFSVIVSNVGEVYNGTSEEDANRTYTESVDLSKNNYGRFSGESVTLFQDGEIVKEFVGSLETDN